MITLGIIGVVAALTMPTLMANHKKTEIATSVKKFYSIMSQAILMSEIDNGPSKDWVKEGYAKDEEGKLDYAGQASRALTYFNRYLAKYIKYVKIDKNPEARQNADGQSSQIQVYLADGTYFYVNNGDYIHFMYDANGNKGPNVDGKDIFQFIIMPTRGFIPYYASGAGINYSRSTRDEVKEACKNYKASCSHLLMKDGWEFKPDYPHKL